jgi:hypothetical protein
MTWAVRRITHHAHHHGPNTGNAGLATNATTTQAAVDGNNQVGIAATANAGDGGDNRGANSSLQDLHSCNSLRDHFIIDSFAASTLASVALGASQSAPATSGTSGPPPGFYVVDATALNSAVPQRARYRNAVEHPGAGNATVAAAGSTGILLMLSLRD